MNWSQRDNQVIWHPFTQMKTADLPIAIEKAQAALLYDFDGNSYIDAISSWWVNLHGHAHPYIAEKVSNQLKTLEHVIFAGFTHQPAVNLAENLLKVLPSNMARIFFTDNGSTAVEAALKIAIQYWYNQGIKRNKIIVLEGSYHGDTFGAMSSSSRSFSAPFLEYLFDVEKISLPLEKQLEKTLDELNSILIQKNVAAFIYEPLVLGVAGMLQYSPQSLEKLIQVCKQAGVLCIADEVMTGFGRTGKTFASDYVETKPDLICLSKGLTGGTMALGVVASSTQIYNQFLSDKTQNAFLHGHSYCANPLACVAAIASLELLLKSECQNAILKISQSQNAFAAKLVNYTSKISNVRQFGTILAFDLQQLQGNSYYSSLRDKFYKHAISQGVLLRPLGNTIYIMPPYCISNDQLEKVYFCIESFLQNFNPEVVCN